MPRKKPTRKDKRFGVQDHHRPKYPRQAAAQVLYSTVSRPMRRRAEEYRVASEVSAYRRGLCASTGPLCSWARKWLLSYKQPFVEEDTYKLTYVSLVEAHLIPYFGNALL